MLFGILWYAHSKDKRVRCPDDTLPLGDMCLNVTTMPLVPQEVYLFDQGPAMEVAFIVFIVLGCVCLCFASTLQLGRWSARKAGTEISLDGDIATGGEGHVMGVGIGEVAMKAGDEV